MFFYMGTDDYVQLLECITLTRMKDLAMQPQLSAQQ